MRRAIPPPDVAVVNPDSGLMARDWYDFFSDLARPAINPMSVPAGGAVTIDARTADSYTLSPSSTAAFGINAPLNPVAGQVLTITIRNTVGALAGIGWAAVFKFAPAFVLPANGFSRSITFHFDGTNWIERYRSTTDIPN